VLSLGSKAKAIRRADDCAPKRKGLKDSAQDFSHFDAARLIEQPALGV
jgi:hypothetical protein